MFILNRKALVRLNAMIAAGDYVADAWSFSPDESNQLLGDNNWVEFGMWHLGENTQEKVDTKTRYGYCFGKAGKTYLEALKSIAAEAEKNGDGDCAKAATDAIAAAAAKEADKAKAAADDITFTAALDITAAADSDEKLPGFKMLAYTGGPMMLPPFRPYACVVDLEGMDGTDRSRPILKDHDLAKIVGHTTNITIDHQAHSLTAQGLVSGTGDAAKEVRQTSKNGFPWQASIGARVTQKEFVPEGRIAVANGRTWDGPIWIARKSVLGEISFVALGADDNTSARIAANRSREKGSLMKTFQEWLEAKGFVLAAVTDQQKTYLQAQYDAEVAATKNDGDKNGDPITATAAGNGSDTIQATADDIVKATRKAAADETRRVAEIKKICGGKFDDIQAKAIEEGWDIKSTELEVLRADRPKHQVYANTGAGKDITPDILCASLAMSGGIHEDYALKGMPDNAKEMATGKQLRHISLRQVCYLVANAAGISYMPGQWDNDFIRALLVHDNQMSIRAAGGGGFSTMSLSGLLENVLNKMLLQRYDMAESVVDDICWNRDTNDFKPFKSYRMTLDGQMVEVPEGGEIPNVGLQDETYQNQVKTQGALLVISRQKIINDDMSAITDAPSALMDAAMVARERAVFTTLYSGLSTTAPGASTGQSANGFYFFSTGAKNLSSSATSALSIASMASVRQKFREQKDKNGNPIMMSPDRILVGPALETTADNLFQGANLVVGALGSTSAKSVEPNLNAHKGKYRPIVSPWMGAQSPVSGFTDTNWMLLGNPSGGKAPLQIGYLRGQRTPILERGEVNFNTLGIYLRVIYDFGVALHDYRTAQWSAGA